jgi:archaetidylinositol phosphate synthase
MLDTILGANPWLRRAQSRIAHRLSRAGISADMATALGAAAGIGAGVAFCLGATAAGVVLLLVSAALDALDGTIARECERPSALGGVLDLCSDRVVEAAVILGIAWPRPELHLAALMLVASWYVNITVFLSVGAAIEHQGPKLIDYPPGILERTEAILFFVALAVLRPLGAMLCYLFVALEVVTGIQRLIFGWRKLGTYGR